MLYHVGDGRVIKFITSFRLSESLTELLFRDYCVPDSVTISFEMLEAAGIRFLYCVDLKDIKPKRLRLDLVFDRR